MEMGILNKNHGACEVFGFSPIAVFGVGVLISVIGAAGCGQSPLVALTAEETSTAKVVAQTTSAALQERFRVTPHASNSELGGQVIEVSGGVILVGTSPDLGDVILLSGGAKGSKPVVCQMAEPRPWDRVTPGMPVTVKGQVWRMQPGSAPLLRQAHLVHVDSLMAESMRFAAEDVCASFADSRSEAHEVLGERWIRVTGAVASIDRINGWLYLTGGTGRLVRCALAGKEGELSWDDDLKAAEIIEVVGQVADGDRRQVILQGCLPPRRNVVGHVSAQGSSPGGLQPGIEGPGTQTPSEE